MTRRAVSRAGIFGLLLGLVPGSVAALQETSGYGQRAVSSHIHGTIVAVALRLHAGSQDDPEGFAGTAWLLARVLEDQVKRTLGPSQGVFTAQVERATTVFTLLAEPSAWASAWAIADAVLFDTPIDAGLLDSHKAALLDQLEFEAGSPFGDFEAEAAGLLAEPGSPFSRPPRGTAESLPGVGPGTLEAYRSAFHRRDLAAQAIVGPLPPENPSARSPAAERPTPDIAWVTGDRVFLARDVTNTWIAVAYPAPAALPRTHLEVVAHLLEEELDPTPPAADRYDVDVRLQETPHGSVLVVEASVLPEAAAAWEERILAAVEGLASEPIGEDFFRWRRRRFRAARLLEESAPEVEARRITADMLREARVRDLGVEIWSLDARALLSAARSLGPPRVFLMGPDLRQEGSGSW
ncbi:MAG: hypothetical protein Q8N53_14405 [Longimicrobiales bacterium]|nr:hypothetical protein [Longimicrobiales bacterium]